MALIVCKECGKQFSDQAAACPNCGCPTSKIQSSEKPKITSQEASDKILEAVNLAKKTEAKALEVFKREKTSIECSAGQTIDLFSGTASRRVIELAASSKKACDDLYTAYQTLVLSLDQTCRPLLDAKPSTRAVKEVKELIEHLNKDSEISNDFTASLNGKDLGDVANVRYLPGMTQKMIQQFWANHYSGMPGTAEEDRAYLARQKEAQDAAWEEKKAREKAQEQSRLSKKEQRQARYNAAMQGWNERERKRSAEMEAYSRKHSDWESQRDQILQKQQEWVEAGKQQERENLQQKQEKEIDLLKKQLETLEKTRQEAQEKASALSFFSFGEKSGQKKIISDAKSQIKAKQREMAARQKKYETEHNQMELNFKESEQEWKQKASQKFPIPPEPMKPKFRSDPKPKMEKPVKRPFYTTIDCMEKRIYDFMEIDQHYTMMHFWSNVYGLSDMSSRQIRPYLDSLIQAGYIEAFYENGDHVYAVIE